MRVLMVNKFIFPRGGAETYMLYVAKCLQAAGHEVALFGMDHPDNIDSGFPQYTCPALEFGRGQSRTAQLGQLVKAAGTSLLHGVRKDLERCLTAFKPDLIHAHNVYNQMPPSLFHGLDLPVILTAHDYKAVCPNYQLFTQDDVCTRCLGGSLWNCLKYRCCQDRVLVSALAAMASAKQKRRDTYNRDYCRIIAPSAFMAERLIEGGISKDLVEVIHNFAHVPEQVTPPGSGILFAGRLSHEKGIGLLFDAMAELGEAAPTVRIAGEGPLEQTLREKAATHGLKSITWLGRISPAQVVEELQRCAVSIIPSRWHENCSMAVMESLASGRPCIVSTGGGNPELVRHRETGWVFTRNDAGSLASVLREFGDAEFRLPEMGRAAHRDAQKRFSEEVHMQRLLGVMMQEIRGGDSA